MYKGSCLCAGIQYSINGELGAAVYCHCSRCRKASGTAFASGVPINSKDLVITKGEELLKSFSTDEGVHRVFCSNCGSPLFSRRDYMPETIRLRLGSLDTPISEKPKMHIFTASKAPWYDILDDLPLFPELPKN